MIMANRAPFSLLITFKARAALPRGYLDYMGVAHSDKHVYLDLSFLCNIISTNCCCQSSPLLG